MKKMILVLLTAQLYVVTQASIVERLPGNCHYDELKRSSYRCDAFIQCANGIPVQKLCPPIANPSQNPLANNQPRLFFNVYKQTCDWPVNVECGDNPPPPTTTTTKKPDPPPHDSQLVCYGEHNLYGEFASPKTGEIVGVKLTHYSGYASCHGSTRGYWNCIRKDDEYLNTIFTVIVQNGQEFHDKVIFPSDDVHRINKAGEYMLKQFQAKDKILSFSSIGNFEKVTKGQKMRLWYGSDFVLENIGLKTSPGGHCVYVQVFYADNQETTTKRPTTTTKRPTTTTKRPTTTTTKSPESPVQHTCYGDKDQRFGSIFAPEAGNIMSITMRHKSGFAECPKSIRRGFWNCIRKHPSYVNTIVTLVLGNKEIVVFPTDHEFSKVNEEGEFMIPGYVARSSRLTIKKNRDYLHVEKGQEMRIWYGSHFLGKDIGLKTGHGGHCVDVELTYFNE